MQQYILLILATAAFVAAKPSPTQSPRNETLNVCWRDNYQRGAGSRPDQCEDGFELSQGLCYKQCDANYTGVGPKCWEDCPPNYIDKGTTCWYPADIHFTCPWYDICGKGPAKGCLGNCSEGYHLEGCACRRPGQTITKKWYTRGNGAHPHCPSNLTISHGWCYEPCKESFFGDGCICWQNYTSNTTFPVECNPVAFGETKDDCGDLYHLLKKYGITSPDCIQAVAISVAAGHAEGPKECSRCVAKVLPALKDTGVCPQGQ